MIHWITKKKTTQQQQQQQKAKIPIHNLLNYIVDLFDGYYIFTSFENYTSIEISRKVL